VFREGPEVAGVPRLADQAREDVCLAGDDPQHDGELGLDHQEPLVRLTGVDLHILVADNAAALADRQRLSPCVSDVIDEAFTAREPGRHPSRGPRRVDLREQVSRRAPRGAFPALAGATHKRDVEPARVPVVLDARVRTGTDEVADGGERVGERRDGVRLGVRVDRLDELPCEAVERLASEPRPARV
jgi:hypothetical protein